jgi:predicted transcriptional regulator
MDTGIIYRITCEDKFYIGSTVGALKTRAATHRFRAAHSDEPAYGSRLYKFLKGKEWKIEKVSEHKAIGRKELWAIEAAAILAVISDPNCLNNRAPCRDKEKFKASQRRYYQKNKEAICAKQRARRAANKVDRAAVAEPQSNAAQE